MSSFICMHIYTRYILFKAATCQPAYPKLPSTTVTGEVRLLLCISQRLRSAEKKDKKKRGRNPDKNRQIIRSTDTYRYPDRRTDRQTRHADRHQADRQTNRQTDIQTDRQADRPTDRPKERNEVHSPRPLVCPPPWH